MEGKGSEGEAKRLVAVLLVEEAGVDALPLAPLMEEERPGFVKKSEVVLSEEGVMRAGLVVKGALWECDFDGGAREPKAELPWLLLEARDGRPAAGTAGAAGPVCPPLLTEMVPK